MATHRKFIFFHGGPGFNSCAEEALLTPFFTSKELTISFWNEPRSSQENYQSQKAFDQLLQSATDFLLKESNKQKVTLVAHSFAAHIAHFLAHTQKDLIEKIIIIAPAFLLDLSDRKIFNQAISDFSSQGLKSPTEELQNLVSRMDPINVDSFREKAILLSLTDQLLFPKYWKNQNAMTDYINYFAPLGVDTKALIDVKRSMGNQAQSYPISDIPTLLIFGKDDFIIESDKEILEAQRHFSRISYHHLTKCAHFPHLEDSNLFLKTIDSFGDKS